MTELTAVNAILREVGEAPFASIVANTIAATAQQVLDEVNTEVQERGWHCNTEHMVIFSPPDVKIAVTSVSGTFIAGETVSEATSLATGRFHQIVSGYMWLTALSGTFLGGTKTLTGVTSTKTAVGGTVTAVTEGEIVLDADVLRADTDGVYQYRDIVVREGKLFERTDNVNTYTFSDPEITLELVRELDFTSLPLSLQKYIIINAAIILSRTMEQDTTANRLMKKPLDDATLALWQDETDNADYNIHDTAYSRSIAGRPGYRLPVR
jgi:hypothetical protein